MKKFSCVKVKKKKILLLVFIAMMVTIPLVTLYEHSQLSSMEEINVNTENLKTSEDLKSLPTPPYITKADFFQNDKNVYLKIPRVNLSTQLGIAYEVSDGEYDFSDLKELPVWVCSDNIPYLSSFGSAGASIILGHRQRGFPPKVFAELDKIKLEDEVIVSSSSIILTYKTKEIIEVKPESLWQKINIQDKQGKENGQSYLILITCTPYGTNWRRLLIITTLEKEEWKGEWK